MIYDTVTEIKIKEKPDANSSQNQHFILKNDGKNGIVGIISCEELNGMLLFKCMDKLCSNTFSTEVYEELKNHIEVHHKFTAWNGMCSICGCGIWRNYNYLFMESALQHLVCQHLVKQNKNTASK